jgi:hypothetical protein
VKDRKAHLVQFTEQEKPATWESPRSVTAMCGEELQDRKPIYDFISPDNLGDNPRTMLTCTKCLVALNIQKVERRSHGDLPRLWYYLCLESSYADRINHSHIFAEVD